MLCIFRYIMPFNNNYNKYRLATSIKNANVPIKINNEIQEKQNENENETDKKLEALEKKVEMLKERINNIKNSNS